MKTDSLIECAPETDRIAVYRARVCDAVGRRVRGGHVHLTAAMAALYLANAEYRHAVRLAVLSLPPVRHTRRIFGAAPLVADQWQEQAWAGLLDAPAPSTPRQLGRSGRCYY